MEFLFIHFILDITISLKDGRKIEIALIWPLTSQAVLLSNWTKNSPYLSRYRHKMPALRLSRDFPYSTTSENKAEKKSNLIKGLVEGGAMSKMSR